MTATREAQCQPIIVDYADGGSYLFDGGALGNFTFAAMFSGECPSGVKIVPTLAQSGENGTRYTCSSIVSNWFGSTWLSSCSLPLGRLTPGPWEIEISTLSNNTTNVIHVFNVVISSHSIPALATTTRTTTTVATITEYVYPSRLTSFYTTSTCTILVQEETSDLGYPAKIVSTRSDVWDYGHVDVFETVTSVLLATQTFAPPCQFTTILTMTPSRTRTMIVTVTRSELTIF
ncbi:hypothetical protein QBC36DRAFT_309487 [Triangularia setosa]|uniref:Uncharacterized protein n=1 Tax=Triangularia setosa TaxID=2587417 RepID=A0AAN6WCQ3_9PEZI|nr:hypothetical protein QBC36DRAFT_309487 [Podospora setosa]